MKHLKLKSLIVAASMAFTTFSANAAVVKSADLDIASGSEFYTFNSVGTVGNSFSDYLSISALGVRELVAGVTGSAAGNISFTAFDLVASDLTTILASGTTSNAGPRLSFGSLESISNLGDYFIHIAGIASGAAGYAGTIALVSPVPEPETYGMLIAGLGLVGFVAYRRRHA